MSELKVGSKVIAIDEIETTVGRKTILGGTLGEITLDLGGGYYNVQFKYRGRFYPARVKANKISLYIESPIPQNQKDSLLKVARLEENFYYQLINRVKKHKDFMFLAKEDKDKLITILMTIAGDYNQDIQNLLK